MANLGRRHFLSIVPAFALGACANRVPVATTQSVDLNRIAFLPIKEYPAHGDAGPFKLALSAPASNYGTYPPVTPGLLGLAIGNAIRSSSEASAASSRNAIGQALAAVALDPASALQDAVTAGLARRGTVVEAITDVSTGELVRGDWKFSRLPAGADAMLDIRIQYAGYFPDKANKGYSPQIYATSQLIHTGGRGIVLESFRYEATVGDAKGRTRYFPAPAALTMGSVAQIRDAARPIRDGITALLLAMAESMADDVDRAVRKLPRLA